MKEEGQQNLWPQGEAKENKEALSKGCTLCVLLLFCILMHRRDWDHRAEWSRYLQSGVEWCGMVTK